MENSIKFIKEIERTHKGTGVPSLYTQLTTLTKWGLFLIGSKGTGKGTIIKNVKTPNKELEFSDQIRIQNWDSANLLQIASRIGLCHNKILIWKIKEWSTLLHYHRQIFLSIIAQIITDGEYTHTMKINTKPEIIDIKNVTLICLIGTQPIKLDGIINNENWEALASDRFSKFIFINPLRKNTTPKEPNFTFNDKNIYKKIDIKTDCKLTMDLYFNQVSDNRAELFAKDYLRAYAIFENKDVITLRDELDFTQLFYPYLTLYKHIYYSTDLDKPPKVHIGALKLLEEIAKHENGITQKQLGEKFNVYDKETISEDVDSRTRIIRKHAHPILRAGLVQKNTNSPVKYLLGKTLLKYFDYYKDNWS